MPWQSQGGGGSSGGPWGGGSGGSGGSGGNGGGPWGRGPGGGGFGGPRPPDFEDFIRKGQDRFKRFMPGGGGKGFVVIAAILVALWLASGFYRVQPDQQGVVLRFGEWVRTETPGLNWHMPYPIESVQTPGVERVNSIEIGFRGAAGGRTAATRRDVQEESLMLTGDQNIIDIDFVVFWKISDAGRFLFNIRDPEATVKLAAESAMREVIGQTDIQPALTEAREQIEFNTRDLLQSILEDYEAGILITEVRLQEVQPPVEVIDAFNDVQRSLQDRDRLRNEADAYRNKVLPEARGESQRVIQQANAYKERLLNEAEGEAKRFLSVFEAYRLNPEVTRRRMYLETMQNVFSDTDTVIIDSGQTSPVPYLPLNELRRSPSDSATSGSGSSAQ